MARANRCEIVDTLHESIYHCTARCVRLAFLLGDKCEHRKEWVEERIKFLARFYGVDVLTYSVMSNHYHIMLRIRPELVATWSDEEVARRWVATCQAKYRNLEPEGRPFEQRVAALLKDANKPARARKELSSLSQFMAQVNEYLSRRANREEKRSGTFFEKRFSSTRILDEPATVACAIYVDLNPIRAGIAETPEESKFTSAYQRIAAMKQEQAAEALGQSASPEELCDAWLSPIPLVEAMDAVTPHPLAAPEAPATVPSQQPRRASNKGFLRMSWVRYLELLDWTDRQLGADKPGVIPAHLAPILERLQIKVAGWVELARDFGDLFSTAAGKPEAMAAEAMRRQRPSIGGMAGAELFCS